MLKRTQDLISQIPSSSYHDVISPKDAKTIFSKNYLHGLKAFGQDGWLNYNITDILGQSHSIQLFFRGTGDPQNSLYCRDCKGICGPAVVALIHFISQRKDLY